MSISSILLVLLLIAIVVVFIQRKKAPQTTTPVLYGLVVLILLVSFVRLFGSCSGGSSSSSEALSLMEQFNQAACYRLGQAVAKEIPAGSALLVIHEDDTHEAMKERVENMVSALKEGLGASYTLYLEGPRLEEPSRATENEEMVEPLAEMSLRESVLMGHLSSHPNVKAVISFLGIPYFRNPPPAGAIPPLYVMGGMEEEQTQKFLRRGVVRAAVMYKTSGVDFSQRPSRSMSHEEVFNMRFELRRPGR